MRISSHLRCIPFLLLLILFVVGGCSVQDPDYYNRLGVYLDSQNKIDDAMRNYKKSLRIDPSNREAHYNLAVAYHKKDYLNKLSRNTKPYWNSTQTIQKRSIIWVHCTQEATCRTPLFLPGKRPLN